MKKILERIRDIFATLSLTVLLTFNLFFIVFLLIFSCSQNDTEIPVMPMTE